MSSRRHLPISPSPSVIITMPIKLDPNNVCKVCGDKAYINNYGALSCSSCKIFFRRNGFHPEVCILCLTVNINFFLFFSFFRIFVNVNLMKIVKLQY